MRWQPVQVMKLVPEEQHADQDKCRGIDIKTGPALFHLTNRMDDE